MNDNLKRHFEIATQDLAPPPPDLERVRSAGRRRRRWEVAGSAALAVVMLTAGALGARVLFDTSDADVAGRDEKVKTVQPRHKIAFTVLDREDSSGSPDIYVSRADGTDVAPFLTSPYAEYHPEWSPDGSRLAFISELDEPGNMDLYVINADGSGLKRLTEDRAIDSGPSWSPDGTRLAFSRNILGRDEIFVVPVEDESEVRLTHNDSVDASPQWSPDGNEIAFIRNLDGRVDIWLMDADGSNERRLTDDPVAEGDLSWSPDGSWLATTRAYPEEHDKEVALVSPGDGTINRVTDDDLDQRYVAWSPDGDQLIYTADQITSVNENATGTPAELHVLDLGTGRVRKLSVSDSDPLMATWRR